MVNGLEGPGPFMCLCIGFSVGPNDFPGSDGVTERLRWRPAKALCLSRMTTLCTPEFESLRRRTPFFVGLPLPLCHSFVAPLGELLDASVYALLTFSLAVVKLSSRRVATPLQTTTGCRGGS